MTTTKTSPKLQQLIRWNKINEVNRQLDSGVPPLQVHKWIVKNGFKISHPAIYEYQKIRKKALCNNATVEHIIGTVRPLVNQNDKVTRESSKKLKSELEALDRIIDAGYSTLTQQKDPIIGPRVMMDAIKLKSELTDGNHGLLTSFGIQELRELENEKYSIILEHLIKYIPQEKRQEAIRSIDKIEEEFYKKTDYYEDYLRAKELPEREIQKRLDQVEMERGK